jgi:hypothetical protein
MALIITVPVIAAVVNLLRDSHDHEGSNVFFVAFAAKWPDGKRFVLNFTDAGQGEDNDSFNTVQGRFILKETREKNYPRRAKCQHAESEYVMMFSSVVSGQ